MLYRLRLFILLAYTLVCSTALVNAQEAPADPKTRVVNVTAFVRDTLSPSVPILIRPEDNKLLNTSKPTFVWEQSTDNIGVVSYTMYLDGEEYFTGIPTSDTDTNLYTLLYDEDTGRYSLTPKDSLSQGTHTWKIVAFDAAGNQASSDTWTFKIDTKAPTLVITTIGDQTVSISSQDASTVPTEPIVLTGNEPLITGTGEANATVTVTLTADGETTQTYTFTISQDGTWSLQLSVLKRELVYTLDFLAKDKAGNISVINDVQFIIRQVVITIPGIPFFPPIQPPLEIPIIPPKEIITEIINTIPPIVTIPTRPITSVISIPNQGQATERQLTSNSALLLWLLLLLLLAKLLLILAPLKTAISLQSIISALRALFVLPWLPVNKQGLVFELISGRPVAFIPITLFTHTDTQTISETTIFTTAEGIIPPQQYHDQNMSLSISHQSYLFPVIEKTPSFLSKLEFYKGEIIQIGRFFPLCFIPIQLIDNTRPKREQILEKFTFSQGIFGMCLSIFNILSVFLFPSFLNIIVTILVITIQIITFFAAKRHLVTVQNEAGEIIPFAQLKSIYTASKDCLDFNVGNESGIINVFPIESHSNYEVYARGYALSQVTNTAIILKRAS